MRNKNIDKLLKPAIAEVEARLKSGDSVPKEYKGYISSFGATIIQCGIRPAVALYLNTDGSSNASKIKLMYCLQKLSGLHKDKMPTWDDKKEKELAKTMMENALDFCERDDSSEMVYRQKITESAIALKLALRTFKLEKA